MKVGELKAILSRFEDDWEYVGDWYGGSLVAPLGSKKRDDCYIIWEDGTVDPPKQEPSRL